MIFINNINDFLFNDMVSIHCIYLIIWCLKKKKNYFVFDLSFELCNIYSLKINAALLTDLYVFDEGNVAKIS